MKIRAIVLVAVIGLMSILLACEKEIVEPVDPTSLNEIDKAIEDVNKSISSNNIDVSNLTKDHFLAWFNDFVRFVPLKDKREAMINAVEAGKLPEGCSFGAQDNSEDGLPSTINFNPYNLPMVEGDKMSTYLKWLEEMLLESSGDLLLSQEPFQGEIPFSNPPNLDPNIEIQISEIEVPGECLVPGYEERDALRIEILANLQNVESIVSYFGTGFNKQTMSENLIEMIGSQTEKWVDLQDLFPNWLGDKISTFPIEGDNEVCHGAAREFYYSEQESSLNASTEATSLMLDGYYCEVSDEQSLSFGDYLYIPGMHSGRYVLKDPNSGRHISFSVQSGGNAPYRFWWIDEDFSGDPFANTAKQDLFITTIDIWRRCK